MPEVSLFGGGLKGKSANITAQQRINCYLELQQDPDKTRVAVLGFPGLDLFANFGDTPARGQWQIGDLLYVVHRGTLYSVNNAGVATALGLLTTTSGRVSMSDNGTQLMVVDGSNGYIWNTVTLVFTTIVDPDFPPNPTSVAYQDSYFIVSGMPSAAYKNRYYISGSYDGLTWDALEFGSAESNPDGVVQVIADHGEITLFGEVSTEFHANTGATDFPYARINGAVCEWGLAAKWSLCKYDNSLAFLAKNRMGEVMVARMNGYQPQRISDFELESIINGYSTTSDATGFSFMLGGHPMYQLNFPTAGASWLYDGATKLWSQLKSYGVTRHRGETSINFLNKTIVSDYANGKLYRLNPSTYTENGDPLVMQIVTRHTFKDDLRVIVDRLRVEIESGVGLATGQGSDPQMMMRYSKDGGHTWSNELWMSMGKVGEYKRRCQKRRLGSARDWTFELSVTDPVKRVLTNGLLDTRLCTS